MSEEILKALMQLFALIVKQDKGVEENERQYVLDFLTQQLSDEVVQEYLMLFDDFAGIIDGKIPEAGTQPTSVKDSVRIFGICKKINKTLTQKQKFVVLVRLLELMQADRKFTSHRMNIINTVSEVFRFTKEEYDDIESFVINNDPKLLQSPNVLFVAEKDLDCGECQKIRAESLSGNLIFLKVLSVDLYFLKLDTNEEISLNGLSIKPNRIHLFANGSTIKMPRGRPIFYSDIVAEFMADSTQTNLSFEVDKISYRFSDDTYGIRDLNFSEKQGKMIGILGSSGAGKTTLLNILSGLDKPTSGSVRINGIDLHDDHQAVKGVIGYIPQDDLLIEELTVFENLYFSAKLCFRNKSKQEINDLVNNTLKNLGLFDKKDLKVGSAMNKVISGGQRKRLNIALELIREPYILFVDEPTSGLSSRDSENVMDLLRELTLKGKLIFVVIHQPSSDIFKMFDNILILDTGGYLVYYGNPVEAIIYFKTLDLQINSEIGECPSCGTVNPELIFNVLDAQVVDEFGRYTSKRKVTPEKWSEEFRERESMVPVAPVKEKPPAGFRIPSLLKQLIIYTRRDFLSKIANRQYLIVTLSEAPILGFILSYIIRYIADPNSNIYIFRENENIPIYIFMSLIVALFIGLITSAEEIFRDRKILKREAFLDLSRSSYLFSKVAILFILSALQAIVFVLIGNSILGIKGMYFEYWLAFFTTAAFANMLGLNVSATFNSAITIYIVIPLLIIPMMVLSGAMFSFNKLNRKISTIGKVPVIAEMMATKWTYEALMVNQFKNNKYQKLLYPVEKMESNAYFKTVDYIPYLQKSLNELNQAFNQDKMADEGVSKINLLKNEIGKELTRVPSISYSSYSKLDKDSFNTSVALETREYLSSLKSYYDSINRRASLIKESILEAEDARGPEAFRNLRRDYHNENVQEIVKNIFERNNILTYNDALVRQYQPIYYDPEYNGPFDFRSHFFSPTKYFMGKYYETFQFNITFVWFMTLILYITLYFELFKNILVFFEKLKYRKVGNLR